METSTPHGRTLAADLCPDWAHDGVTYRHKECPAAPLNGAITFTRQRDQPLPPQTATCPACGTRWHRFQSRWEKEPA